MLSIHYFASYRERLGQAAEQLPWPEGLAKVGDLRDLLVARGGDWSVLAAGNLMAARNQVLCDLDEPLQDGDEVAFFPPVTGG